MVFPCSACSILPVDGRSSTAVKTPVVFSSYIAVHRYLTSVLPNDREFEVLRSLGSGLAVKDVAERLRLSAKTISTYRSRLLQKMGFSSNADLIRYVREHELLK